MKKFYFIAVIVITILSACEKSSLTEEKTDNLLKYRVDYKSEYQIYDLDRCEIKSKPLKDSYIHEITIKGHDIELYFKLEGNKEISLDHEYMYNQNIYSEKIIDFYLQFDDIFINKDTEKLFDNFIIFDIIKYNGNYSISFNYFTDIEIIGNYIY